MLTSLLIFVPLVGAILVWVLPLSRESTGGLALLVALAEVGLWLGSARNFDFSSDAQQYSADQRVVRRARDLVRGRPLRLPVLARRPDGDRRRRARSGTARGSGRERARAYFGLLLFLVGSLVGVFAAQDLILFYVFFEAMLIPIYVLVGVWGGPQRVKATITFVIYTMVGLAADARVDHRVRDLAGDVPARRHRDELERLDVPRLPRGLRREGTAAPVPRLAAPRVHARRRPRCGAILSGVVSKAAVFGLVCDRAAALPGAGRRLPDASCSCSPPATLVYGSLLAFRQPDIRGVIAYSSMAQMGLIVLGIFAVNDLGLDGAVLQSVNHGLVSAGFFLLAGMIETRAGTGDVLASSAGWRRAARSSRRSC